MIITLSIHGSSPVITCTRSDGSVTYQKSRHGAFFGPHDLLHYAVETVLVRRESFLGLVAKGWNIESFEEPGTAAQPPVEALHTEMLVNQLMIELNHGATGTVEEFNRTLAASCASGKRPLPAPEPLSEEQLGLIRGRYAELMEHYRSMKDGERMELQFPDVA